MTKSENDPDRRSTAQSGDGAADDLPFPETDFSPALQRTIKERLDRGDLGGVDKEKFLKLLGKTAQPLQPDEE